MKRLQWLDIAKGIAILAVVAGHMANIPWEPYRKMIFSFHMPLFFIATGYTVKPEISWKSVKKLAVRLLGPYIFACVLVGAVEILRGSNLQTELLRMVWGSGVIANYGPGLPVTGAESIPVAGTIWFLPCMFFSKVFFTAFLAAAKERKEWMRACLTVLICGCGYLIGQQYKLPLGVDIALFNFIFLYAGYIFKKYNGITWKNVTVGALMLLLWSCALNNNALELSARHYRQFPACIYATAGAIAICYLVFHVSNEVISKIRGVSDFLVWCGKNSLEILLIHHFDGLVWKYEWFAGWLPDLSGLSELKQGSITAIYKVVLYVLICAIYIWCKGQWQKLLSKWKEKTPEKVTEK